jgi:rSAM/selenodomain-associated transferase 1
MPGVERLILFARSPRLGEVKTRLAPPLTPGESLALHKAMLVDQIAFVASLVGPGRTGELCADGPWPTDGGVPALPTSMPRTLQAGGDLGRRMDAALARGHAAGAQRIAIIGTDAPTLPARIVEEAFTRLRDGADAVVTPAPDGGYALIATAGRFPALFRGIPWGTDAVLTATRRRAQDAGVQLDETEGWADVDRIEDLPRLLSETERDPGRAPATAAATASLQLYFPEARVV